jgi:hypothetical protein
MTNGSVRLLSYAVRYASESIDAVVPGSESLPTPCERWDLRTLLLHLNESIDELRRTVALEPADVQPGTVSTTQPAATPCTAGTSPWPAARRDRFRIRSPSAC